MVARTSACFAFGTATARRSSNSSKTPAEFDENFRLYGSQNYSPVIGHGFEFQDAARRVAPAFPRTVYLITAATVEDSPNVAGIRFAFEEPSYLAGMLAGWLTKTNVIGCIGGTELPPAKRASTRSHVEHAPRTPRSAW